MEQLKYPYVIRGGNFEDHRGKLKFVNDFSFHEIKRFYTICHDDVQQVRAWQGHKIECKFFYVITGSFVVAYVKIDDFQNPSDNLKADYLILRSDVSEILAIPNGYANGLKALTPGSEIMVFSTLDLKNSMHDENRYPSDKWFDWEHLLPFLI